MSTTTNFKRIALVAVAALGLGVLSSVPSQATISALTVTTANGTASTSGNYDSLTAATVTVNALLDNAATDSVTVTYFAKSVPTGATANAGHLRFIDSTTVATANSTKVDTAAATSATVVNYRIASGSSANSLAIKLDSVTAGNTDANTFRLTAGTNGFVGADFRLELDSATLTAGTYTYTVVVKSFTNGASAIASTTPVTSNSYDVSIVVSRAAAVSLTATAAYSYSRMGPATAGQGTADAVDSTLAVSATAGTTIGYILVAVRNASNGATTAEDSLTAVVTGVGLVCIQALTTCGKNIKVAATAGDYVFGLQGDGVGGTSNVVITSGVTGLTYSHSLTYYATASKMTAAAYNPTLGMGANSTAIAMTATDGTGTNWAGAAYIYASAAADALIGGSATTPVACSYSAADKTHFCPVTAIAAGTAKFKVINAATIAAATVTSNEVSVTVSNSTAASVKLAFNKATYVAGEKAYITVTVLDAAGKTMQGKEYSNLFATGGIASSYGFATGSDTLTAVLVTTDVANSASTPTTAGTKTYTVYMPATGSVKITATGGTSLPTSGQVEVSATATVSDSGTQALAAVTALATTVASLKTLITTLTNLVLKIQKKVKA